MSLPILQGTLDLMILRTLATMGPQHAYGLANRLQQVSEDALSLNQGTIYPALVRLEQHGWTSGSWGRTENNREAKYYTITMAGLKALEEETARWRQMAGVVEKLLAEEQ
jgi:PadR family transcriptional regulator PadR